MTKPARAPRDMPGGARYCGFNPRAGRPGAAAVDVYEQEPLVDRGHPLLTMDNVVCTPHLGYVERDQLDRYFSDQFARVLAFERGEPADRVNPEVLAKR